MSIKILRANQAQELTGLPRSSFYSQINKGLIPPSIQLSARSVGWIESEIDAVNIARIQGKTDDEIRAMISDLVKNRTTKYKVV